MPNEQVWGQVGEETEKVADQDLVSLGNEIIEVVDIEDDARIALKASNKDGASSVAIEAEGQLKVTAVSLNNPASKGIDVVNTSTNASARALKVQGTSELDGKTLVDGHLVITGAENGLYTEGGLPLLIGTTAATGQVIMGNAGDGVRVIGDLEADDNLDVGENLSVEGDVLIGPGNATAEIDAAGTPNAQILEIGTNNTTADVVIGRVGTDVQIADDLEVNGDLRVGPVGGAGEINAGDAVGQNLQIGGGNGTANVVLGRANQTVDLNCQARLNSNALVMNNAASRPSLLVPSLLHLL
jgi:hypothetical protein